MTMHKFSFATYVMVFSVSAFGGACEENFQSVGDARNGLFFQTQVQMAGLNTRSALGQLQQIGLDGGYELGGELITGTTGEISFLQTTNHPTVVVRATADNTGQVALGMKLASKQKVNPEDVKTEFCSILGKLKSGKEGEAIADATRAKTGSDRFLDVKAEDLSADIGAEMKRALAPVASIGNFSRFMIGTGPSATSKDYEEAFGPLRAKYIGKKYRIDGQIYTASRNSMTGDMEIAYLVTKTRGLLGVRQESSYNNLNFTIQCILAKDQAKLFATLTDGNWITLEGAVNEIQPGGMQLRECRQSS